MGWEQSWRLDGDLGMMALLKGLGFRVGGCGVFGAECGYTSCCMTLYNLCNPYVSL